MNRFYGAGSLALLIGLMGLSGCGGSYSGVQAVAPSERDHLVGITPSSGDFTLYRAVGYAEQHDSHVEPVWTVPVTGGQKIGFRWIADPNHKWDPYGGFHLIAFAGDQARDLGAYTTRDVQYVWAGSHGDVAGYFQSKAFNQTMGTLTLH